MAKLYHLKIIKNDLIKPRHYSYYFFSFLLFFLFLFFLYLLFFLFSLLCCYSSPDFFSGQITINFSYSSAANSFMSLLTSDTDSKQPSSSSAFQITNLSQVSSVGKPPLSSLKRKCSLKNLGSDKCGGSSGRYHCSKKRFVIWVSYSFFFFLGRCHCSKNHLR